MFKKINWKVRFANKNFWLAFIPAILLLAAEILKLFGVHFEYGTLEAQLCSIVEAAFGLLAILGAVNDPTTAGFKDSDQAMTYTKPKE